MLGPVSPRLIANVVLPPQCFVAVLGPVIPPARDGPVLPVADDGAIDPVARFGPMPPVMELALVASVAIRRPDSRRVSALPITGAPDAMAVAARLCVCVTAAAPMLGPAVSMLPAVSVLACPVDAG